MPRPNRHFAPDSVYHVTNRGVERRLIYRNDADRQIFMSGLLEALRDTACSLLGYCLMGNHFHLLIGVAKTALGAPMHRALSSYAAWFNNSIDRKGHLFQARYFARLVFDPAYLHNVIAYIHRNPVEAKLAPSVDRWAWSSHADWMSLKGATLDLSRLEALCGMGPEEVRAEYMRRVAFMAAPGPKGLSVLELLRDTASMLGLDPEAVASAARGAAYTEARIILIKRAQAEGHPDTEIARALNCSRSAIAHLRERNQPEFATGC